MQKLTALRPSARRSQRLVIEEAKKASRTDRAVSITDVADFSTLKSATADGIR